ncbi:aldose 1-epimerase [Pelagibius sp. Alg239-R121]|uniref:aldose 1-epimerase n=1 Tax=Pelagibius sp. Alg239-R121 TaxID=2993448 RepID=UPI0024A76F13|nr:aldose 1-epimerase [Pelagibius sp. Alg239-R121]
MDDPQIEVIQFGGCQVRLAPEAGGVMTGFLSQEGGKVRHWMREVSLDALRRESAFAAACYPLVPFSNRIAYGRFTYGGQDVVLPPDPLLPPHAIHGHGWRAVWQVSEHSAAAITLRYRHTADSWPWSYEASQRFSLDEKGLKVEMTLSNLSDMAMPAGFGLHPHFPLNGEVCVLATVAAAHLSDETLLPVGQSCVHDAIGPLREGGNLPEDLDLCFGGWDGCAEILWPEEACGLRITASRELKHLVVFTPPGEDFFCVEPVSHCINAVNLEGSDWGETGLVHLAPSETLAASVLFQPFKVEP